MSLGLVTAWRCVILGLIYSGAIIVSVLLITQVWKTSLFHLQFGNICRGRMKLLVNFLDFFTFTGSRDNFYGILWSIFDFEVLIGNCPIKIYSENAELRTKITRATNIFTTIVFISLMSLALNSQFIAKHDHLHHKNPMILRMGKFQLTSLTVAATLVRTAMWSKQQKFLEVRKYFWLRFKFILIPRFSCFKGLTIFQKPSKASGSTFNTLT